MMMMGLTGLVQLDSALVEWTGRVMFLAQCPSGMALIRAVASCCVRKLGWGSSLSPQHKHALSACLLS